MEAATTDQSTNKPTVDYSITADCIQCPLSCLSISTYKNYLMDGQKRTTEFQISSLHVMIERGFYEERRNSFSPQIHRVILRPWYRHIHLAEHIDSIITNTNTITIIRMVLLNLQKSNTHTDICSGIFAQLRFYATWKFTQFLFRTYVIIFGLTRFAIDDVDSFWLNAICHRRCATVFGLTRLDIEDVDSFWLNAICHRRCATVYGLTRFAMDDVWQFSA
jgi:hypothetical protein